MRQLTWILIACAGCLRPSYELCGDQLICPDGTVCDLERNRCLDPAQVAACVDLAEGDACLIEARAGTCRGGSCEQLYCGDGYVSGNEACDGTDLGDSTCLDAGFYAPEGLACAALCNFDTSRCSGGTCGDGVVNGPELCDGDTTQSCVAIGFDGGAVGCSDLCAYSIRDCSRFGWNAESLIGLVGTAIGGVSLSDQWVVGADGRALRFEGSFWNPWPTGTTTDLSAIWAISSNDVWTLSRSEVLHFNGTEWIAVAAPTAEYVDVWAAGSNAVYIATRNAGVLAWNGTTWSSLGTLASTPLAIRGSSSSDIWVTTEQGPLAHWNGTAWTPIPLTNTAARFLDVNAADDVWVAGNEPAGPSTAVIGHWNGTTWTLTRRTSEIINAIASSGPNDTWLAVGDSSMRHFDGVAWTSSGSISISSGGATAISGLISLSSNDAVAVSSLGLAYRYRGQSFGSFPSFGPDPFSAPETLALWSSAANDIYITNLAGEVFHYDGVRWTVVFRVDPVNNVPVKALWGRARDDVWIGADDGRVFHFDGNLWTPEVVVPIPIRALWGSGTDVWAFASGAHHRVAGVWELSLTTANTIRSVSGTGPDDIWVLEQSSPSRLHHYDGTSWIEVVVPTTVQLRAVVAVTPNLVFVAGANGRMQMWNGATWSETYIPVVGEIDLLAASAPDDVVAASDREMFHFNGVAWTPIRIPADPNPPVLSIAALQVTAGRIDFALERYRVRTLIRTRPLKCRSTEVNCADAVDDDCNGMVDSTDPQCP